MNKNFYRKNYIYFLIVMILAQKLKLFSQRKFWLKIEDSMKPVKRDGLSLFYGFSISCSPNTIKTKRQKLNYHSSTHHTFLK